MKTFLAIFLLSPLFINAQAWQAAKRYSQGSATSLSAVAVAVAPDSSIYVVGAFLGTVAFDNLTLSTPAGSAQFGFLLKLNPDFQAVWAVSFPQQVYDVALDASGNVFVAGSQFNDSLSFVGKFAGTDGQILADFFSTGGRSRGKALDTDASGNCYLAGWMDAQTSFGSFTPSLVGGREAYLLRLSPDLGQVHWAVLTGASSKLDEVDDVEVDDANGFVYTGGNYFQSFQLFPCGCYNGSFFVEKHAAGTGTSMWKDIFQGGSGTATRQRLAISPDGSSVFTAASFKHTVTVPPSLSLTAESNGNYHIFMTRLNASAGTTDWAQKTAFAGDNYPQGLVWADSQLYQHGYFKGVTVMANDTFIAQGSNDPFFAAVDPANGEGLAAETFAGTSSDIGADISAAGNQLVVCGNAGSSLLHIGSFALSGNNGFYVARKIFAALSVLVSVVDQPHCFGSDEGSVSVMPQGGDAPYGYLWNNGATSAQISDLAAGNYSVTVTDAQGATFTAGVTLNQPLPLTLAAAVNNTTITATAGGGTPPFEFSLDGQNFQTSPVFENLSDGDYSVTVRDANGCTAVQTGINVISLGPVALFEADVTAGCVPLTVQFTNTSSGDPGTLSWTFPGGQPSASTEANPVVTYYQPGSYAVVLSVTNAFGQDTLTAQDYIAVQTVPAAAFTFTVDGLTLSLANQSQNGESYSWTFGDGTGSSESEPVHTYADTGVYVVELTAVNSCGASVLQQEVVVGISSSGEPQWLHGVRIMPNPTNGLIRVNWLAPLDFEVKIDVFDAAGRSVLHTWADPALQAISLDCSDLPAGMYSLRFESAGGVGVRRFIVAH